MITASVGREPEYIGKPAPGMVYACLEETGCTPKQTLLIGDRIYTDMECGKRAGVDSCLVLTGEASAEEWKTASGVSHWENLSDIFHRDVCETIALLKQPTTGYLMKNIDYKSCKSRRGKEIKCQKSY